jgi:hypothetical protein
MALHRSSQALTQMHRDHLELVLADSKDSKALVEPVSELVVVVAKQTYSNNSLGVHLGVEVEHGLLVLGRTFEEMTLKPVWE